MTLVRAFPLIAALSAALPAASQAKPARILRAEAVSPGRPGHCVNPQWSRDGRALAYERVFLQDRKIELNVLADVFDKRRERKIRLPEADGQDAAAARAAARFKAKGREALRRGDVCREFTWGPKSDPDIFVHACNVVGGTYQLFWSEGAQLTNGRGGFGQPALSPVGWRLAFVSAVGREEGLSLIDNLMDGNQARPLVRTAARIDRQPVWSPNGRSLAFVGHGKASADLFVIRDVTRATETLVRLTTGPDDELNPSWSPDGRKIAYFGSRPRAGGRRVGYDLFVIDVDARPSAPVRVATNVVLSERRGPAWSADGRFLVYVKNFQRGRIVDPLRAVAPRAGAVEVDLNTATVSNQDPVVTSAGGQQWLAFTSLGYRDAKKLAWRRVFVSPFVVK